MATEKEFLSAIQSDDASRAFSDRLLAVAHPVGEGEDHAVPTLLDRFIE